MARPDAWTHGRQGHDRTTRCRFVAGQAESLDMDQQRARKTFTYQLMPTSEQQRSLETVVWRCRERSNAGLHERTAAQEQCRVCVTFAMQAAYLPASKEVRPEYHDLNAQVLHDVLHRLHTAFAAVCRRLPPPAGR